jgi:hypothetical protein
MFTRILSCWLLLAAVSQAAVIDLTPRPPVSLSSLMTTGDSVQVGDVVFSDFIYFRFGNMPTAANVQVTGFQGVAGVWGVSFVGDFRDSPYSYASGGRIWYTATPADPALKIVGAGLEITGLDNAHVYNFARVNENLSYPNGTPVGQLSFVAIGEEATQGDAALTLTPRDRLYVMSEIYLAGYGHDAAAFGGLHQSFTLQHNPEPATLGMAAVACLAVLYSRRTSCVKKR